MMKYMCDFETSTQEWLEIDKFARVWLACCVDVSDSPQVQFIAKDIDTFMEKIKNLGNCEIFFHNLKFDGQYIVDWLIKNGYKFSKKGEAGTFDTIISKDGEWFKIVIVYKKYSKNTIKTTIYDSFKKIPISVDEIAKAFEIDEKKGIINYDYYRAKDYEPKPKEIEYIVNDCKIVAKALSLQFKQKLDGITIGCDALRYYKRSIGDKRFKYYFPELNPNIDEFIRNSYRGGFVMLNDYYTNKRISGYGLDVNSLFPAVMYLTEDIKCITGATGLPYGIPEEFDGKYEYDDEYPLFFQKIACEFKLKEGHLPTLQLKNYSICTDTEYLTSSKGQVIVLTLTNIDLELMYSNYDVIVIDWLGGYKFKSSDSLFRNYVDLWYDIKRSTKGGHRQIAKLMLNSLYGKFATRPDKQNLKPQKTANGFELVFDNKNSINDGKTVYTAMASFITAIARCYIIKLAEKFGKKWVYSDTDSLFVTDVNIEKMGEFLEISGDKLGAFKIEHDFNDAKFLRAKTYILHDKKIRNKLNIEITCAGMPDRIKDNIIEESNNYEEAFNAFDYNKEFNGKLIPKRVNGGVVLVEEKFTIKLFK